MAGGKQILHQLEPPDWLDQQYLNKALQEGFDAPNLKLIHFDVRPATYVGDNFASQMFRISCEIQKEPEKEVEPLSIILKTTHESPQNVLDHMNHYWETEALVMGSVLPKLHKILEKAYPNQEPFGANLIWEGKKRASVVIIHDLKEFGYKNADRMVGLDKPMTELVLDSLAKFHASSLALFDENPKLKEPFWKNIWDGSNDEMMRPIIENSYHDFLDEVATWEDIPKEYYPRLEAVRDTIMERTYAAAKQDEGFKVLLHGDCWINNFMFSTETGKYLSFRFVDFQNSCINSPNMDLTYLLFTSPGASLRISCLEDFLTYYHTKLMVAIKQLTVTLREPYTLQDLMADFKKRIFFGFISLIIVYPLTVCEQDDAPELNEFFEAGKQFLYKSRKCKEMFQICMPYIFDSGAL